MNDKAIVCFTLYTYHRVWSDTRHDSSRFRHPDGHENPTMRYHRVDVIARDATLGAFHPGEQVLRLLPADERLSVDPAMVGSSSTRGGSPVQVVDGDLYLGNDPSNPRIGIYVFPIGWPPTATQASSAGRPAPILPSIRPRPETSC